MSKHLPKAALRSFSDIQRESVAPQIIDVVSERVEHASAEAVDVLLEPVLAWRQPMADLRIAEAKLIVERHTSYAAVGGCLPLLIFDALGVGLIIFNMVRELATHYRLPFKQDQAKAIITALLGGALAPGLGSVASYLVNKIVPGGWLFGVAASSVTAAAFTRYAGDAFIKHFESGGSFLDINLDCLRNDLKQRATN